MGKRSDFARKDRDLYRTPAEAVAPLLPHLAPRTRFAEICAADGVLVDHLTAAGHRCVLARDIVPLRADVMAGDALALSARDLPWGCVTITNPPWKRAFLHALIRRLGGLGPAWLLFDADWVHTRQAAPMKRFLQRQVSIGRVKWEPGSPHVGKDNCAWHLFGDVPAVTAFFGRDEPAPPPGWMIPGLEAGGASRARGVAA